MTPTLPPRQVCHRRFLAFLLTHIGSFKIDLSTVYKQPGEAPPLWLRNRLPELTLILSGPQTTGSTRSGPP